MSMDAILQFEFKELPCGANNVPIPKMLQEGNVVLIPRTEGEKTVETPLYIRQHLVEKLQQVTNDFENTKLLHAYITGAPGCGKTCFFWMWAFMKVQDNKRVLFIQHRDTPAVWVLENNLLRRMTSPDVVDTGLETVVLQLLQQENGKFDFAILDGVRMTEEASKNFMNKLKGKTGVLPGKKISKTVFVTSLQFKSPTGVVNRGVSFNEGVDISFDSWRESDYDCAVQYPSVTGNETIRNILLEDWNVLTSQNPGVNTSTEIQRINEAVKLKYRYAGGCARFMFDYKVLDLMAELDLWMSSFHAADWEEFAFGAAACGATIAVNTLMQRFAVGRVFYCAPVSEYVLRRAYQECGSKLAKAVKTAAKMTNNPSLAGWAFEMGELEKLNRALADNQNPSNTVWSAVQIRVVSLSTTGGERLPQQQLTLCPLSSATYNNGTIECENEITSGTLISCDVWNQGCFDAALYIGTTLFTLQVTTAKSHSLLLNYITELRKALLDENVDVKDVVHVAIVRNSNVEAFRFAQAQGTGRFMPGWNNAVDYHVRVVKSGELKKVNVALGASPACQVQHSFQDIAIYNMERQT